MRKDFALRERIERSCAAERVERCDVEEPLLRATRRAVGARQSGFAVAGAGEDAATLGEGFEVELEVPAAAAGGLVEGNGE